MCDMAGHGSAAERYCVRLTPDLKALLEARADQVRVTPSEIVREALTLYLYGQQEINQAYNDGFQQARKLVTTICLAALSAAQEMIPVDAQEAVDWANETLRRARVRKKAERESMYPGINGLVARDEEYGGDE
jgi:predicted transcriptional regulator